MNAFTLAEEIINGSFTRASVGLYVLSTMKMARPGHFSIQAPQPLQTSKSISGVSLISGSMWIAFFTQAFVQGLQGIF